MFITISPQGVRLSYVTELLTHQSSGLWANTRFIPKLANMEAIPRDAL